MKRKYYSKVLYLVVLLSIFSGLFVEKNFVGAKSIKKYVVYGPDITKFKVSGNKLVLKAVKEWNDGITINGKSLKKQKLSLKLSKSCKWSQSTPGSTDYKYLSYKTMRRFLLIERKEFKKYGEYDSGSGLFISVKNGKVIRVNLCVP